MTAHGATAPTPPSIADAPVSAPPSGTIPSTVGSPSPANTDTGVCITGPGEACEVEYLMKRGIAKVTFFFSDGTTASKSQTCYSSACTKAAIGYPNEPWREALTVDVTGPTISIIYVGPVL